MTVLERWILAAILPAGGQVFAFVWVVFLVAAFGLADPGFTPLHDWTVYPATLIGIFLAAVVAPTLLPTIRIYSLWRRTVAGVLGTVGGWALIVLLRQLGWAFMDSDDPPYIFRVVAGLALFYGSMAAVAFLALRARPGPSKPGV